MAIIKDPEVYDFSRDYAEVEYDNIHFHYIGDAERYISITGKECIKLPNDVRIFTEWDLDNTDSLDWQKQGDLIREIWSLIVDIYDFHTNLGGEFDHRLDMIDDYIDSMYAELDYEFDKRPMSEVLFYLNRDIYTGFAYDIVVSMVDTAMDELAGNGITTVCDFEISVIK